MYKLITECTLKVNQCQKVPNTKNKIGIGKDNIGEKGIHNRFCNICLFDTVEDE